MSGEIRSVFIGLVTSSTLVFIVYIIDSIVLIILLNATVKIMVLFILFNFTNLIFPTPIFFIIKTKLRLTTNTETKKMQKLKT